VSHLSGARDGATRADRWRRSARRLCDWEGASERGRAPPRAAVTEWGRPRWQWPPGWVSDIRPLRSAWYASRMRRRGLAWDGGPHPRPLSPQGEEGGREDAARACEVASTLPGDWPRAVCVRAGVWRQRERGLATQAARGKGSTRARNWPGRRSRTYADGRCQLRTRVWDSEVGCWAWWCLAELG
jgi:hypothetical protein